MGQSHTQPSKLPDMKDFIKIIGSTAQILVALYKNLLKLKEANKGNPVIDSAVALDMQTAEIRKKLSSSTTTILSQTCEAIGVGLTQLARTEATKTYALSREPELNDLQGKTKELHIKRDQLAKRYAELVDEQFKIMGNLLSSETYAETEITHKLKELEKKRKSLNEEVDQYTKQYQHTQTDLNAMYAQVYPQVPDKSKIPTPMQEATAAPRRSSTT